MPKFDSQTKAHSQTGCKCQESEVATDETRTAAAQHPHV